MCRLTSTSHTADVVVLGAGIIGLAVARRLAGLGLDVLVVESGSGPGSGSSGRCDGNVLLQTKEDELLIRLTQLSIETYRDWQSELGVDIRFEQNGSLVFMTSDDQARVAEQRLAHLRNLNVSADLVDGDALTEMEPHLIRGLPGAIYCHDDAEVYPPTVVAALMVDARRRGCRLLFDTSADELLTSSAGAVSGVRTSAGTITAGYVVNAMGVWAPSLRTPADAPKVPVEPRQGILIVTEERPGVIRHNIREASYITDRSGSEPSSTAKISFAAEPTYRGNLLLGSSRQFVGYDVGVDQSIASRMMERAVSLVPKLSELKVLRTFAGLRPWTPDNKPLVGASAGVPGYFLATGHEGEGIGLAPATADLIAAALTGENVSTVLARGLQALSPDRFTREDLTAQTTTEGTCPTSAVPSTGM